MENLVLTQLSTTDIKNLFREALQSFINENQLNQCKPQDEVGGVDLAVEITGLSKPTIYSLASQRKIPHSKPSGKKLYFSRRELLTWLRSGKRQTQSELAAAAETFSGRSAKQNR